MAVAEAVTKALSQCEINSKGDTPKLTRCTSTLEIFREMAGIIRPGLKYFQKLQAQYQAAWWKIGGAKKLGRKVLIGGDAVLRSTFLAAYENCDHDVSKLWFSQTYHGSDFALIEEKLALTMPAKGDSVATVPNNTEASSPTEAGGTTQVKESIAAQKAAGDVAAREAAAKKAAEEAAAKKAA